MMPLHITQQKKAQRIPTHQTLKQMHYSDTAPTDTILILCKALP